MSAAKKKKERRVSLVGVAFAALLLLVVAFLVRIAMHRPPAVELPQLDQTGSGSGVISDTQQEFIRRVEVTPETVQRVIERLARPDNYSRAITIERYWADGSGQTTAQVSVADGWARVDLSGEGEEQRHIITGDGRSWIWYGTGGFVFSGAAALTADEEQSIPTYENILLLDPADIAVADYRALDTASCIYVETAPDETGCVERWWVSVDNGLLVAAERTNGARVIYRMAGLSIVTGNVTGEAFRLPDGETLHEPRGADTEESETEG